MKLHARIVTWRDWEPLGHEVEVHGEVTAEGITIDNLEDLDGVLEKCWAEDALVAAAEASI